MQSENSTYSHFVNLREQEISHNIRFNVYDFNTNSGIECALWPHLYPTRRFCGTLLGGKEHRSSLKIYFMNKVFGQICDYGTNFELLQFHYDLWIFKTVSAAITTGRNKNCSAVRALEDKTFSQEYWKWQHRSLIDAVRQLGYPSLFITISPSEWSFPIPPWISQLRELTGRGETELAAYETIHIVHILEQIVRGYMCGSNDKAWKSHLFSYQTKSSINNVLNYFYRFEFQKRGTVHMHMLVWLKSMSQIGLNNIRADIPWNNKDDAFLVYNLQSSDKGLLQLFDDNTTVTNSNGTETLKISHPAEAFAQNIRGYITTILPTLQCRMDVQSSDGHGLVLKYVSSYVSKTHGSFHSDCLYTVHTTPYQAAFRHLKEMTPLEPEMWLSLSSKKVAWNPHRVKKFAVPLPNTIHENTIVNKYCARPNNLQHMTLLQWLREVDTTKVNTPVNRKGMTFVAAKLVSVFRDEYFFQDIVLNVPFKSITDLLLPNFEEIPQPIKYFTCALQYRELMWTNEDEIRAHFEVEGNKSWFVANIIMHVRSLRNMHLLWTKHVLTFVELTRSLTTNHELDNKQKLVISLLQCMLQKRKRHYESINCALDYIEDGSENEEEIYENQQILPTDDNEINDNVYDNLEVDWQKYLLVVGRAGTGKSFTLTKAIETANSMHLKLLVATPTGFLSTAYKDRFGECIDTDTLHAAFYYPVSPKDKPMHNWNLSNYDVIIIDELSMVPVKMFEHLLSTISELPIRPIVLLAGDDRQLQPIETVDGSIQTVDSAMIIEYLNRISMKVQLTKQFRNVDHNISGPYTIMETITEVVR